MAAAALPVVGALGGLTLGGTFVAAVRGAVLGSAVSGLFGSGKTRHHDLGTKHGARLGDLRV